MHITLLCVSARLASLSYQHRFFRCRCPVELWRSVSREISCLQKQHKRRGIKQLHNRVLHRDNVLIKHTSHSRHSNVCSGTAAARGGTNNTTPFIVLSFLQPHPAGATFPDLSCPFLVSATPRIILSSCTHTWYASALLNL